MLKLVHPLARFLKRIAPAPRRPHTHAPRLRLESLEGRDVPTGNITAVQSGTTLFVTGVNGTGDNSQELTINGNGPDAFILQGDNGTTVNSGGGAINVFNVKTIVINMGLGNDVAIFNNAELSGNLTFNGGAGDDTLLLGNDPGFNNFAALSFNGGDGDDTLTLQNGTAVITNQLTAALGNGFNTVNLGLNGGDAVFVGALYVTGGTGDDTVSAAGDTFSSGKNVTVFLGAGNNRTLFEALTEVTIGGTTTIATGIGDDAVTFGAAASTSVQTNGITINASNGNNTVDFNGFNHTISGNLTVNTGTGVDVFQTAGDSFSVEGNLRLINGSGGNITVFASESTISVSGATTISNTIGDDAVTIGANGVGDVSLGNVSINNGPGAAQVFFNGFNHTVAGNLSVVNGVTVAGDHFVFIAGDTLTVTGNVAITNGNAVTTTTQLVSVSAITIGGTTTITNFTGDDLVVVGDAATTTQLAKSLTIRNNAGQGQVALDGAEFNVAGNILATTGASAAVDLFNVDADLFVVTGSVTVNHGQGDSNTAIAGVVQGGIGGLLSVTAGTGVDSFAVATIDLTSLTVNLGNGGSNAAIGGDVNVAKNVSFTGGADIDIFTSLAALVGGGMTVNVLAGADQVTLNGGVTGATNVVLGDGADNLVVENFAAGGTTTLNAGNQNDIINVQASTFANTFSLLGGAGDDELNIAVTPTGISTVFSKLASINAGLGNDTVIIGVDGDLDNRAQFLAAAFFNGGGGFDALAMMLPKLNSFQTPPQLLQTFDVVV